MRAAEAIELEPWRDEDFFERQNGHADLWTPRYGEYNIDRMREKVEILVAFAIDQTYRRSRIDNKSHRKKIRRAELITQNKIDIMDADYYDPDKEHEQGSFGFTVPFRARRKADGDHDPYMNELLYHFPILEGFSSDIAQRLVSDTPPAIIDTYGRGSDGRRGRMLLAPFFEDMAEDIKNPITGERDPIRLLRTSEKIMNDTFNFVRKLNIDTLGMGAIMPRILFTLDKYGVRLNENGFRTTTGHAGTIWLMGETCESLQDYEVWDGKGTVAVQGLGNIGESFLKYSIESLGFKNQILVYDHRDELVEKASSAYDNVEGASSAKELLQKAKLIVCAATKPVDLMKLGLEKGDLDGTIIIDDSQPGVYDPHQVYEFGGRVIWPIGMRQNGDKTLTLSKFDYSGTGPARRQHFFGCEMEAAMVHELMVQGVGNLAVRHAVTPEDVMALDEHLREAGCMAAPLQALGQMYITSS